MRVPLFAAALLLTACPADDPKAAGETESGGTGLTSGGSGNVDAGPGADDGGATTAVTSGASGGADTSTSPADSGTASGSSSVGSDATGDPPSIPIDCGGTTYACGDGIDNDGDGHVDLFDPECTGPCDDDESSFQTGIPGDNMDCKQDCFFDGNSGQGDDGCIWSLRCDPENPGANIGCEYTGGANCDNMPPNQEQGCIDFCIPFVPPGCDCFGCCLVTDELGNDISIFLNSHPDCSFDNLDACEPCTQSDDCVNTCEDCELCFGQEELPPECDGNTCDFGDPCETVADCPTTWYCLQECCYPPPPG